MASRSETALLLINNDCTDININNIIEIVNENFDNIRFIMINNELVEKDLFANYLPIATSSDYLKLNDLSWKEVCEYSEVILITNDKLSTELTILALFYRIITAKTIRLIKNDSNEYTNILEDFFDHYPFVLTVYYTLNCKKYELPEIEDITDLESNKTSLIEHLNSSHLNISINSTSKYTWKNTHVDEYNLLFNYILNNGTDFKNLLEKPDFPNIYEKSIIKCCCSILYSNFKNVKEFKFYDSQFSHYESLANKLQVSIPRGDQNQIFVYKTNAADYNFRNLSFKNVLINNSSNEQLFVLPFYKDEQATRQTVRFLIMSLYSVNNNSTLVDLIVIYLFMKVSLLDDKLVRTKYENIARLFLKRHGSQKSEYLTFLESNRAEICVLKKHFKELESIEDDTELFSLFDEFVSSEFKLEKNTVIKAFEVVYCSESDRVLTDLTENKLEYFPDSIAEKNQLDLIEINTSNWPSNQNFKCPSSKLQLNSSLPYFVCIKTYDEFLDRIKNIEWIKKICKHSDKLVLKGGAILDILADRNPKDYDIMNIGMTNQELIDFLIEFVKEVKPKSVHFISSPVVLFQILLENGDLIELIANINMTRENLFSKSYLPDQICFVLNENRLYANEYTLWALNYGYCQLDLDIHPRAIRLSKKLNKLGFNFYYQNQLKNNTAFLKGRLERYIWSISQSNSKKTPSYRHIKGDEDTENESSTNLCQIIKKKVHVDEKILFTNKDSFLAYIKERTEEKKMIDDDSELITLNFNGAIIMSEKRIEPRCLSNGLDWSF